MKILNTLAWIKIHSIKLSRSGNQNVFLSICWRNIQVWTLVYEVVCTSGFEFLKTFVRIFEMYEFSIATFIKVLSYQSFDVKCLSQKIGGVWFSLLINKLIDSWERKIIYENLDCI